MSLYCAIKRTTMRICSVIISLSLLLSLLIFPAVSADAEYDLPWLWPVPGSFRINSLDYYNDGGAHGQGQCIDIDANGYTGDTRLDVVSATSGEILYIQNIYNESTNKGSGWGNYVIIRSGNVNIIYAHLKEVLCDYGPINAGDVIGKMGNTGNSTGVHLHMQAYPVGGNSSSNEIRVFDQYKDNPLYATRFRFWKGLQNTSVRYGEWISTYFQTLSGAYYLYSGGLDLDYTTVPLGALVTVIRTSGAKVYAHPSAESQYQVGHLLRDESVAVSAYYQDAFGDLWLLLSDTEGEQWISLNDVGFKEYTYQTILKLDHSPSGTFGGLVDIVAGGELASDNVISELHICIRKDGEVVATGKVAINESSCGYSFSLASVLSVDTLVDGEYVFELSATETATFPGVDPESQTRLLTSSKFYIDSSVADHIPPLLEPIDVRALTPEKVELFCTVTDNSFVNRVIAKFEKGSFTQEFSFVFSENGYSLSVPASLLGGAGQYSVVITAYDAYGNSDQRTLSLTLPAASAGETWKVCAATTPNLRVRSAPSLSSSQIGKLYPGNTMVITEFAEADTYLWGKCWLGWCALRKLNGSDVLCEYVEGTTYTLQYHLNGGSGELPASQALHHAQNYTLSSITPTRTGYTFLGWAETASAKTAAYQSGDIYTATRSTTLFAVWSDTEAPTIDSVDLSTKEWTGSSITLTVLANDNAQEIYYSYDSGVSWRRSASYEVENNVTFEKGSILVKDASGNQTEYPDVIVIENIDTSAPDISAGEVTITSQEQEVTVSFSGFVDNLSGIDCYEIHLTKNGGTDQTVQKINSSDNISLEDGVYTGFLRVTDRVGNFADLPFPRFLVGERVALNAPSDLTVLEVSSTSASVSWNAVNEADFYQIEISLHSDFSNSTVVTSNQTEYSFTDLCVGNTYYLRIFARCEDDIFLMSAPSTPVSFITLSGDTAIYGFVSLPDAVIDTENATVAAVASYQASALNLTAVPPENGNIRYFTDATLKQELVPQQISAFPFTDDILTVYLLVTAENGNTRTYALTVARATESAALPSVKHIPLNQSLLMGEEGNTLYVTATSADFGTITVEWFVTGADGIPVSVSKDHQYVPVFPTSGVYTIYAVVTNTNTKCQTTTSSVKTETSTITVHKFSSVIEAICTDYDYNGSTPTVFSRKYQGDGAISYRFFSDAEGLHEIEPPINAGIYYVQALATETDLYYASQSKLLQFEIRKLANLSTPTCTVTQPTLRVRKGYVTINDSDVEYRINGADWISADSNPIELNIGDIAEFRFVESTNIAAGAISSVTVLPFEGTEDIVPNGIISMRIQGDYLFVDDHSLTASELLLGLAKTDNVYLYDAEGNRLNGTDAYLATGGRITVEDEEGEFVAYTVVIKGDINQDGIVNQADVLRILRISNGMEASSNVFDLLAGDMNGDGILTSMDAHLANQKI